MLSFFKSNNPGVVVFYILFIVTYRLCFIFTPADTAMVFSHTEPLSQLIFGLLKISLIRYVWLSPVLSGVLCFIQALLVNDIVNENKMLPKKNYVAGLLFITISSFFKSGLLLTPALISLTFVILASRTLFSLIKKEKAFGEVFDVGFLLTLSALSYFPAALFILFGYIGLAIIRAFAYRDWIIILLGFISPLVVVFTWYFWMDKASTLPAILANAHGSEWLVGFSFKRVDYLLFGSLMCFTIAALVFLPGALYSSLIQVRKFSTSLITLLVFIAVSFSLQQTVSMSHWVLLGLPLAIVFSMVIMQIKKTVVSEVMHLILILLVLAGQYLPLLNIL